MNYVRKYGANDTDENGNLNFHAKGLHSSSVEDPQIKESQRRKNGKRAS